ncbi:MAG: ATP synthase F1 subunit delta [Lachnospiraceae bacterium]|nr:ATP synthase F1 subunit delta [Lachnospiraceae bacterium]
MAKQVDTTYGEALFSLAVDEGRVDELYEEVLALIPILHENEDLMKLLTHPHIDMDKKKEVVEASFKGRISDDLTGMMILLTEKEHGSEIIHVFEYFLRRVKKHKNIGLALVTSAVPLSSAQKASIEMKLIETTSYKSVDVAYRVDPSLIGGLTIRIDDRVVDSSIKTRLHTMSHELSRK